ncbi:MAG: kynurenine formamidase [Glaciecola sp.]|jgi:kynurenine formamidase
MQLLDLVAAGVEVFDLGREMFLGMPQSPNHPEYRLTMPRRHGDGVRPDGGSAANDLLVTGTHVGTHIDALGHVSHCGELYGGLDAQQVQSGGKGLTSRGIDEVEPMLCRGVLLDIPALLGVDQLAGGTEITPEHLAEAEQRQGSEIRDGDVVLVRSGWGRHWPDPVSFVGRETGVPGVSESGATWLASRNIRAAGADTIAFEQIEAGKGHAVLPAHRVLLVQEGINIIETMALEALAAAGKHEFLFVLSPLKLVGGTGSPVRPLAVVQ